MPAPVTIALPCADRKTSYAFYAAGLGFDAPGELADDGAPEPLRVVVNEGAWLMLIPPGGFGWTIAGGSVAGPDDPTECQLVLTLDDRAAVDSLIERARSAGAAIVAEPEQRPWGYAANFADPDGHLWMALTAPPE